MRRQAGAREYAQNIIVNSVSDVAELLAAGDIDAETADVLVELLERPVDLNGADRSLLEELPGVTPALAAAIVQARVARGGFAGVEELTEVAGVSSDLLRLLAPFVVVRPWKRDGAGGAAAAAEGGARVQGRLAALQAMDFARGPQAALQLRTDAAAQERWTVGFLGTYRPMVQPWWDFSSGRMVASSHAAVRLESLYGRLRWGRWQAVVGNYAAGFGERLVFDNTQRLQPRGVEVGDTLFLDSQRGVLKPKENLCGAALTWNGGKEDAWQATLFVSRRRPSLYQYNFWYGYDAWGPLDSLCTSDAQCDEGYVCGVDRRCHSSALARPDADAPAWRNVTLARAYTEELVGAAATYRVDPALLVGVTAYRATQERLLAGAAAPRFSISSGLPQRAHFGAFGAHARYERGRFAGGVELARNDVGAHALLVRGNVQLAPWAETQLVLRAYAPGFDNPFSRAPAAPDESFGQRQRNERGVRWRLVLKPWPLWTLVSDVDVWQHPQVAAFSAAGRLKWQRRPAAPLEGRWLERAQWRMTRHETLNAVVQYGHTYTRAWHGDDGGGQLEWEEAARRVARAEMALHSTRWRRLQGWFSYGWSGVREVGVAAGAAAAAGMQMGQRWRLRLRWGAAPATAVITQLTLAQHDVAFMPLTPLGVSGGILDGWVDVEQRFGGGVGVRLRYRAAACQVRGAAVAGCTQVAQLLVGFDR